MKNNNPKISVIVPVYKVEQYLPKCIDSILAQTFQEWELLLIDDGSPDNCGEICDKYALKDTRIRVFHKENEGVSSARNFGLDHTTGEYVMFVDSDDWLSYDCLQVCIDEITKDNLESLQFGFLSVVNGIETSRIKVGTLPLNGEQYIQANNFNVCVGGGIYKRNIIESNQLRFPKELKLAEDQIFVLSLIKYTSRIKYLERAMYYYLQRSDSAVHNSKSQDILLSCEYLYSFSKKWNAAKKHIDNMIIFFIIEMLRNNDVPYRRLKYIYSRQNIQLSRCGYDCQTVFLLFARLNFYASCKIISIYLKWKKC